MDTFTCPVCKEKHKTLIRYSNCVCNPCLNNYKTRDKDGNEKCFSNIDFYGGIRATCNGNDTTDFSCYVNGVLCEAIEARFGGIVIMPKNINIQ